MTAIYLLDTTIWIDLVRTNSEAIRRKLVAHIKSTIGLSVITWCELQSGIERRARRHPNLEQREQQLLAEMVTPFEVFVLDARTVASYARVRADLEESGASIGALDTFIAAQAVDLGATLVTSNEKEFRRVSGLSVENWR
jgi:tRNA(fMet)-specific endonuclease VapC